MLVVGCYPSWSIYDNFSLADIPVNSITHLTYCFANIQDNVPVFGDPWADMRTDSVWNETLPIDGNYKDMIELKKHSPSLQTGISIGGWGAAQAFSQALNTSQLISEFAERLNQFTSRFLFDYVDIDWEFPATASDHASLCHLMDAMKAFSDNIFLSLPCSVNDLQSYNLTRLEKSVRYFTLMGYNLSGEWSSHADYHSHLFTQKSCLASVDEAVRYLMTQVSSDKIILGVPFYGKRFDNCSALGAPFGSVRDVDYEDIDRTDVVFDGSRVAAHVHTNSSSITVFDCEACVVEKVKYAQKNRLAGILCWDLSKDRKFALLDSINKQLSLQANAQPCTDHASMATAQSSLSSSSSSPSCR